MRCVTPVAFSTAFSAERVAVVLDDDDSIVHTFFEPPRGGGKITPGRCSTVSALPDSETWLNRQLVYREGRVTALPTKAIIT